MVKEGRPRIRDVLAKLDLEATGDPTTDVSEMAIEEAQAQGPTKHKTLTREEVMKGMSKEKMERG